MSRLQSQRIKKSQQITDVEFECVFFRLRRVFRGWVKAPRVADYPIATGELRNLAVEGVHPVQTPVNQEQRIPRTGLFDLQRGAAEPDPV